MKISRILVYFFLCVQIFITCHRPIAENKISLEGVWHFKMDPDDEGVNEHWFNRQLHETVQLPGSMKENEKGFELTLQTQWTGSIYDSSWFFTPRLEKYRQPDNLKFPFWLTPDKHYVGPAWYQKEIEIPQSWTNKQIFLHLERPHWETTVWINSVQIGMQNSLSAPHVYNLSESISPGEHQLIIRIDNRIKEINPGPDSHSITDHTQGNWNGIVGKMYLEAQSPVHFEDVQLYPDVASKSVDISFEIGNDSRTPCSGKIQISAASFNSGTSHKVEPFIVPFEIKENDSILKINYPMGEDVQLWDEFYPALYKMNVQLMMSDQIQDQKTIQFGMRDFRANGTRFEVNGHPVFLRGTVDCCVYPQTGYPPTDVESWDRVFRICKEHGLNHIRFHSWCPPKAAFIAADKAGFYLQPEGPSWANHGTAIGYGEPIDQYLYEETEKILREYGNHPSFCMMAYGNEPAGRNQVEYLSEYVNHWKSIDNRRVYTSASIGRSWPLVPESEFIVRSEPRGLPWDKRPQSEFDYGHVIEKYDVPYVAHEMGQYCVFPNFNEIPKYTGVYQAVNFEMFREDLTDHHMGDQADAFLMASGKLQALCYKSELEATLRTPGFAGTQLLALNDFSGQGTALVGVLDAFWDEKGYISAEEFNQFFGKTVPLARLPKFVFTNQDTFTAEIEVAHFDQVELKEVIPHWKITSGEGVLIAEGKFDQTYIPIGNCFKIGLIEESLSSISKSTKCQLKVMVGHYVNEWEFWVYPEKLPKLSDDEILVCHSFNHEAEEVLKSGGKVLLLAAGNVQNGKDVVQYFRPVFWNTSWFKMRPPHTLGILCDPDHPVFSEFPTEYHSNLQWWEILHKQQVMNLKNFPSEFRPLIQPIDTWFLNRRLGMLFEANVDGGKLMVCSADLATNPGERIAARQLFYSIKKYMLSDRFNPGYDISSETIRELFEVKQREKIDFYTRADTDDLKPKVK